jgi:hypothetical protein
MVAWHRYYILKGLKVILILNKSLSMTRVH